MRSFECDREEEILQAVRCGRWPQLADPALVSHAQECEVCSDLVLVAQFLAKDHASAREEAALPSAGFVWWKAQLLARRAEAERATQPIAFVERIAGALGALCSIGFIIAEWSTVESWSVRIWTEWSKHFAAYTAVSEIWKRSNSNFLLAIATACLALVAVTVWLARVEE